MLPALEHLVRLDDQGEGNSATVNRLAAQARGEWLLPLADDDLLLPAAIKRLLEVAGEGDVIYGPPIVVGNSDGHFWGTPPAIPSFGLVRRTLWEELQGYDVNRGREEDRDLWTRALDRGARFVRIEEHVWVYRFRKASDGSYLNKSYNRGIAR